MSPFLKRYNWGKREHKMPFSEINIAHDIENHCFTAQVYSHVARLDYFLRGSTIIFTHTGVPTAIEGRGIGSMLVKAGLEYAQSKKLKVESLCWFVSGYIQRHPESARDLT
jgi:predicted GNAT family acetyltransferase